MKFGRTAKIIVGLVLTLGLGSLPYPVWDNELADVAHLVRNELIYWTLVAVTLLYVLFAERRPLSSIGLRVPSMRDALIAVAVAVVSIAGLAAIYYLLFPLMGVNEDSQLNPLLATPGWWLAVSVIRAGVSEEVLFRGYPIERLQELTGSRTLAAGLPLALFALAHVGPWGWAHLLIAAFGGGMLTLLYLWRRNLWASIIAHCIIDGVAVLGSV